MPINLQAALRTLAAHLDAHPELDPDGISRVGPAGYPAVLDVQLATRSVAVVLQLARWAATLGVTELSVRRSGEGENGWVHLRAHGTLDGIPIVVWGPAPELTAGDLPNDSTVRLDDLPGAIDAATAARARAEAAALVRDVADVVAPVVALAR